MCCRSEKDEFHAEQASRMGGLALSREQRFSATVQRCQVSHPRSSHAGVARIRRVEVEHEHHLAENEACELDREQHALMLTSHKTLQAMRDCKSNKHAAMILSTTHCHCHRQQARMPVCYVQWDAATRERHAQKSKTATVSLKTFCTSVDMTREAHDANTLSPTPESGSEDMGRNIRLDTKQGNSQRVDFFWQQHL